MRLSAFYVGLLGLQIAKAWAQSSSDLLSVSKRMTNLKTKTSRPIALSEESRIKSCPPGFKQVGKQCLKGVTLKANVICPPNTALFGNYCAIFLGKQAECTAPYVANDEGCAYTKRAPYEEYCPKGYFLSDGGDCSRIVKGPTRFVCPGGSIAKGDRCIVQINEATKLECRTNFQLNGDRCFRSELYDCTPLRQPSKSALQSLLKIKSIPMTKGKSYPGNVEDYVLTASCKRIYDEPARKSCARGRLVGKVCVFESEVNPIQQPGRFSKENVPTLTNCPENYEPDRFMGDCVSTSIIQPTYVCPAGTKDLGNRCASLSPVEFSCPPGFSREKRDYCAKTLFAAPVIQYSVRFSCTGKHCGS